MRYLDKHSTKSIEGQPKDRMLDRHLIRPKVLVLPTDFV